MVAWACAVERGKPSAGRRMVDDGTKPHPHVTTRASQTNGPEGPPEQVAPRQLVGTGVAEQRLEFADGVLVDEDRGDLHLGERLALGLDLRPHPSLVGALGAGC